MIWKFWKMNEIFEVDYKKLAGKIEIWNIDKDFNVEYEWVWVWASGHRVDLYYA